MSGAVVRLPTAAPRKVQQRWNKDTRAAARALRQQAPFRYRRPGAPEEIEPVPVEKTPVLALAFAIYGALTPEQKEATMTSLIALKGRGSGEAQAILDIMTLVKMEQR